jgi:hypothetical protein
LLEQLCVFFFVWVCVEGGGELEDCIGTHTPVMDMVSELRTALG